jgi:predicted RNA-binding protein YlxR (DUF448 family)
VVTGRHEPGRGAWLCRESPRCFEQAVKRRAFERALRSPVAAAEVELLRIALESGPATGPERGSEGSVP